MQIALVFVERILIVFSYAACVMIVGYGHDPKNRFRWKCGVTNQLFFSCYLAKVLQSNRGGEMKSLNLRERQRLVELLLSCPSIRDSATRRALVNKLPFASAVEEHDSHDSVRRYREYLHT